MPATNSCGPYAFRLGWWTWKSITPAPPAPRLPHARSARPARGSRAPRPARAPAASPPGRDPTNRSSWSAEAGLRLVARRLERLRRPVGELDREPEGRRVECRAAERPGDEELARRQHRRHPDDLQPRDRAVGVGEDAAVHVRGRVLGVGAKAPARDVDGRLAEQVVEPVAGVHAVRDDRRQPLERAQPPRVALRVALGVGALVADRGLDQQRPPERARRDQLAEPVDGGVVAVGEPDLQPLRRARGVAHVGGLGDRERDRLLGEHVLPGLERGPNETCGRRRWRCDHDRVHVGVREDGRRRRMWCERRAARTPRAGRGRRRRRRRERRVARPRSPGDGPARRCRQGRRARSGASTRSPLRPYRSDSCRA